MRPGQAVGVLAVDELDERHLLGRLGGAGGVVDRVRVELVGVADGRSVGLRGVADHRGSDAQRLCPVPPTWCRRSW